MDRLHSVLKSVDIPPVYRNTPVGNLLASHNLEQDIGVYDNAQLLIGMCMDHRKRLKIPDNFAYIIRAAGANLKYSEFMVSYAISVGGVSYIALIGHNQCGMVNLESRKKTFIEGMINIAGWKEEPAEAHFNLFSPLFEISNEIDFTLSETKRLRSRYPGIQVAPMLYLVEDNKLYPIREE